MEPEQLQYLFDRYETDTITESGQSELLAYLNDPGNREEVLIFFEESLSETAPQVLDHNKWDKVIAAIKVTGKVRRIQLWKKLMAAATILILFGSGIYFGLFNHKTATTLAGNSNSSIKNDFAPGTNGAILTLANGQKIILDSLQNGRINNHIIKSDHQIEYAASSKVSTKGGDLEGTGRIEYNTMETPRGRQYQLMLSDGTKVWLNASSSIIYPIAFTGKERRVQITGEAYFEVVHNNGMPFIVKINTPSGDAGEVEVLGTHFNINSYGDEETMKTTLLEGKVKVSKGGGIVLLQPGQQAVGRGEDKLKVIKHADTEETLAWINGKFLFRRIDIQAMMRQISRWYDVEVSYPDGIPKGSISGEISRNVPASQTLSMLEFAGIHFKIENKKIIVMP
jgi:transmembrane sensor